MSRGSAAAVAVAHYPLCLQVLAQALRGGEGGVPSGVRTGPEEEENHCTVFHLSY